MRAMLAAVLLAGLASVQSARAVPDETVLMGAFLQTHLIHLASTQIDDWADGQAEPVVEELEAALDNWTSGLRVFSRKKLTGQFGNEEKARSSLTAFVSAFTQAEKKGDTAYLKKLCGRLELEDPWPADYAALRQAALQSCLSAELDEASAFLGAVETWLERRNKTKADMPSLEAWLDATLYKKAAGKTGTAKKKTKPAPPADPLAAAEAGLGGFSDELEEMDNPLDELRSSRAAKRKKAMEQARDGMASVAREREAAEQEVAAKKLAAAQAEAAALQAHADKLAAVEKEALEQRQNSWTSRLKNIVASTISTATGVFFGSVGQRAGEAVTDAVFNDKK